MRSHFISKLNNLRLRDFLWCRQPCFDDSGDQEQRRAQAHLQAQRPPPSGRAPLQGGCQRSQGEWKHISRTYDDLITSTYPRLTTTYKWKYVIRYCIDSMCNSEKNMVTDFVYHFTWIYLLYNIEILHI